MRGFPALEKSQSHRVRRWDALVLGGALPGLIASIALARRGCRVLMLEDSRTARSYAGLREPFHLCGAGAEGILGAALRGLGLPLIDQRRFRTTPEPLQVVTPEARIRLDAAAGAAAAVGAASAPAGAGGCGVEWYSKERDSDPKNSDPISLESRFWG